MRRVRTRRFESSLILAGLVLYLTQLIKTDLHKEMMARASEETLEIETAREMLDVIPRVMRHVRTGMREMAAPQLTIPQMRTLAHLSREPNTVSELAEWLGVSAPAMSKMVAILERRGLVQRSSQKQDRRQVILTATEEGKKLHQSMRRGVRLQIAEKLKALPDPEKQ